MLTIGFISMSKRERSNGTERTRDRDAERRADCRAGNAGAAVDPFFTNVKSELYDKGFLVATAFATISSACIASLALLSFLTSETYLKPDHFIGGGSVKKSRHLLPRNLHMDVSRAYTSI
jgi:hypothetical protein